MNAEPLRIAVLMGGFDGEREVSLSSGKACAAALAQLGHEVISIDVTRDLLGLVTQLVKNKPAVAFNAMHGAYGEDGVVRGILDWLGIPSTHSSRTASALAMDKHYTARLLTGWGIAFADQMLANSLDEAKQKIAQLNSWPVILKPRLGGSTIGVYCLEQAGDLAQVKQDIFSEGALIENYLTGREFTVGVMNNRALAITEIIMQGRFYDYDRKYKSGRAAHICPAKLPDEIGAQLVDWAELAHRALGCAGVSRSDFRWDESRGTDGIYMIEINSQPGLTAESLAPEQAEVRGITFPNMLSSLIKEALEKSTTERESDLQRNG